MSSKSVNLPRIASGDDAELNRLVNLLEVALNGLEEAALSNAILLPPTLIQTTDTRVFHGLGQRISGYFVAKSPADVRVFDGAVAETIDPMRFVTLRASSAQTVTLVVF